MILNRRPLKLTHSILHEVLDLGVFPGHVYEIRADMVLLLRVRNVVVDVHQVGQIQNAAHMTGYVGLGCIFACVQNETDAIRLGTRIGQFRAQLVLRNGHRSND